MKRRELREHAFKLIFAIEEHSASAEHLEYYLSDNAITGDAADAIVAKVNGVFSHLEEIDAKISENIKGYTFDRISRVSLAVLRLGVFEILFDEDVPDKVAISEAMEIAATYEDEKSKPFVNGVLGAVLRSSK